jgi:hypothetical protein
MRQTLTEGYAQPPEHQNVPPLYTFTHAPNRFRSLIFGFRKSKSLRIRPLVFQLHAATPLVVTVLLIPKRPIGFCQSGTSPFFEGVVEYEMRTIKGSVYRIKRRLATSP